MILTDPNNIQYLSKPHNSSKGAKSFLKKSFKTFKGQPLNRKYLEDLDGIQRKNYENYMKILDKYSKQK